MKALTFHGKLTLKYESVSEPIIEQPTDVLVKVHLAGICGSDLHPYHEREKGLDHGTVMGHEFVGEIVDVGKGITSLNKGEVVFCPFTTNCGQCFYCERGLTARCVHSQLFGWVEKGNGLHGGQAEFVRVPLADSSLLKIPNGVLPEEGLLLGDIFSTGYYCAEQAEVSAEGIYAVIGCGPVGLLAVISAIEQGARHLYAIDAIPERLAMAERFGAIPINFKKQTPIEVIEAATEGRGADAVLEVVGSPSAGRAAVELLRPGGIISTVGVHTETTMAFSPVEAYDMNITYKCGRCSARQYMEKLLPVVQSKKYDLVSVISHRLPLEKGVEAYRMFDKKEDGCTKAILKP